MKARYQYILVCFELQVGIIRLVKTTGTATLVSRYRIADLFRNRVQCRSRHCADTLVARSLPHNLSPSPRIFPGSPPGGFPVCIHLFKVPNKLVIPSNSRPIPWSPPTTGSSFAKKPVTDSGSLATCPKKVNRRFATCHDTGILVFRTR